MNGGTAGSIIVSFAAALAAVISAWLSMRAQKRTAQVGEAAAAFEGYDELAKNYREEIADLRQQVRDARGDMADCEARCRDCRNEIGELVLALATLRSVVMDEVAQAAADVVLAAHGDTGADEREAAQIRRILRAAEKAVAAEHPTPSQEDP